MKRFLLFAFAAVIMAAGCKKYDDTDLQNRVGSLENRVAKLEELCKQLNSDISSLRTIVTALQNNDYVTGVIPVTKNGETVGYTITFSKSSPITIYHGENGKDGADGKDGYTPQIGVRQDADGIYYWTLDGEWLTDSSGNKIKAEGGDSTNGKDGITPRLKIEDGWWWVSYDNEQSWEKLGKATGNDGSDGENGKDGEDGKDGENGNNGSSGGNGSDGSNGDSFFKDVDTTSSNEYVIFTLADGTQIKLPTWYAFEQLKLLCNQMNTNIESLQKIVAALEKNDYIVSCTPLMEDGRQIGYTITFAKSGAITIYHGKDGQNGVNGSNGADGHTPDVSAKRDVDGILYWTVDDEWLLDDKGEKIPVAGRDGKEGQNGITPQFKIEDGCWWVSYDDGDSWNNLGKATGDDGDSMFKSVTEDEDYVYITLSDSDEPIAIPKHHPLSVTFDNTEDIRVLADKTYPVKYTITGADEKTVIRALAQDGYRAVVEADDHSSGTIKITTPSAIVPSEVLVFVSDGKERTIMRSINFVEGVIIVTDKTYTVGYEGGTVEVSLSTNIDYTVEIPEADRSWLSVAETRAVMRSETLTFTVARNDALSTRYSAVKLVDDLGVTSETILITQRAGSLQNVSDNRAGSLEERLGGVDKALVEELKVTGHLNIFDYEYIKTLPNLNLLDLTGLDDEELPTGGLEASKIPTVLLPLKLKKINNRAFYGAAITSIYIPETVEYIGDYAFYQCKQIKGNLIIPDATTYIGDYCFYQTTFDGTLTIGNSVENIGQYAFSECNNFTGDLVIPNSVTTLGESAFRSAKGFTGNLTIGNGVTEIPSYCFYECDGFTGTIKLGESVVEIGDSAFYDCSNLSGNLIIPDSVVSIYRYAFYECSNLKGYLMIGSKAANLGSCTFRFVSPSRVYCKAETPPDFVATAVYSTFNVYNKVLYVPIGCKDAYAKTNWVHVFSTIEEVDFD